MKTRNIFMSLALMCMFSCISFTFDTSGIHWLWLDKNPEIFILAGAAIILGLLWFRAERKLKKLS